MTIKTGDRVFHRPSGETWVVAFVRGDDLAWCGWPEGVARLADCELVKSCTEEESLTLIQEMAAMHDTSDHRCRWAKQELARRE